MAGDRGPQGGENAIGAFDPAFVDAWRSIEPRLRRSVERFGVPDAQEVDDVLAEVAFVLLRTRLDRSDERLLLQAARRVAQWVVLDRRRNDERRRRALLRRGDPADAMPDDSSLDAEESAILRLAVQQQLAQAYASLPENDRRALKLMLRGGPYTGAERVTIHRARQGGRLADALRDLLGACPPVAWARRIRSRAAGLPDAPFGAAVAAVASAVAFGVFPQLAALPSPSQASPPVQEAMGRASAGPPPHAGAAAARVLASTLPPDDGSRQIASPTRRSLDRNRPPVSAAATARLPGEGGSGEFRVTVDRPVLGGTTTVYFHPNCDSPGRRVLCDVLARIPPG